MKKIMMITVTAGEGHNSMAKAIRSFLEENPNNKVKTIDIFKKYSPIIKQRIIDEGYMAACRYALPVYNFFYRALQRTNPEKRNKVAAQGTVLKESAKLLQDIYLFEPDVIICTHFYGSMILTNLKKICDIPAKTISVVTDYTVHPFWEASVGIDHLVYPTENLTKTLLYKGFKQEQLLPIGLPVRKEFSEVFDKQLAREELGLDKEMFTVLLMFGGGGFGENVKVFKKLLKIDRPFQIMVVNGKDEKSKKKIEKILKAQKTNHKVFNYGFINFVSKAMSAADILVGKAGGISTTESINKCLPMTLSKRLAEQEKANMKFLVESGAAISYGSKSSVQKVISDLYDNPDKLEDLKNATLKIRKPQAIFELGKIVDETEKAVYKNAEMITKKQQKKIKKDIKKDLSKKAKK